MDSTYKLTEFGESPEGWEVVTIPDVALNFDNKRKPLSTNERSKMQGQYPYYGAAGIIDYINNYRYDGKYLLVAEDGTVTRDGVRPMLQLARGNFWVSNHAHVLQCEIFDDTLFLYYQLSNTPITAFITGAVQPKLSQENLNKISFLWPRNNKEREAIVRVLYSLDEKIELNHQMNKTLEAIGQALFKHWFVDFEFPDDKGKPYKSSGGKMVESELGKIPKGWKVGDLIEMTEVIMGQSPPGESYNETGDGMPFYQGNRDFGFRYPSNRVFCVSPTRLAKEGDILLSVRAPVGELNIAVEECAIGRGLCAIRMRNFSNSFLLYSLKLKTDLWDNFNSEGTVFGCLNKTELHKIKIVVPPDAYLKAYDKTMVSIGNKILNNEMQNRHLSQIRDSLLPLLMSGKIRATMEGGDNRGE